MATAKAAGTVIVRTARKERRSPPTHWATLLLLLAVIIGSLVVDGYAHNTVGGSRTNASGRPAGLVDPGPILDLSGKQPRSVAPTPGQIALTFDDGPDPRWTPRVLAVLRRHHVHATFFVVGAKVARHPGLARRIRVEGHDIGSHTFTHADLSDATRIRRSAELSLTQVVLAGTVGVSTSLFRLPYSSSPEELTRGELHAAQDAARYGYLLVTATNDSEDWRRPGVGAIVARSLPAATNSGGVILMHDAGGDRSQTVAALDRIITESQRRGDRFVTVSQLIGQRRGAINRPVSTAGRVQGVSLLIALFLAHLVTRIITALLVPIAILAVLRALIVVIFAARHARTRSTPNAYTPPVSVIVPAYNEEAGIEATVRSLVASDYPHFEVIVVDDGSTDSTADRVRGLALERVELVQQGNGGKAAALNAGIAHARHDVIVMIDGDTVFEPSTLRELVAPLADAGVGAVSGNTKVANRGRLLGAWQHIEYVIGFNLDRRMFDLLRCMPTVPGAVGAFRRLALDAVGGMSTDTLAEDTDITMALNRGGWRVVYEERARAWTEAPAGIGALWRQRYRWSYGTMQAMWKHRGALREGGPLGRYGLPYVFAFQVLLPMLGPAVDVFTLYGVLFLHPMPVLLFWLGFNALNLGLGAYAFYLDGERWSALWWAPLQQVIYRQLMYLVVIQSVRSAIGGHRLHWHRVPRHGSAAIPPSPAARYARTGGDRRS